MLLDVPIIDVDLPLEPLLVLAEVHGLGVDELDGPARLVGHVGQGQDLGIHNRHAGFSIGD